MQLKISRVHHAGSASASCILFASLTHASSAASPRSTYRPVWNIVYLGDSITEGAPTGGDTPPRLCTSELRRGLRGADIYMANDGHSGHTTVDFLPSSATDFPHAEQDAASLQKTHPGRLVFSVMLGTNDSAQNGPNGSPVSPASYERNLLDIFRKLLADFPGSLIVRNRA